MTDTDAAVERVAEAVHDAWNLWGGRIVAHWHDHHARETLRRKVETPYSDLHELEKETARDQARKYIAAMGDGPPPVDPAADRAAMVDAFAKVDKPFEGVGTMERVAEMYFSLGARIGIAYARRVREEPHGTDR